MPASASAARPPLHRALPLLAAANFAAGSAGMIVAGILQLIASDMHWSAAQAGRLISYYALGFAVLAPLLGALLGTVCRKQIVLLGLGLVAAGSVAGALTVLPDWLQASRLVVAAGGALTVPSVSAIASYLHPEQRPRALAFVLTGLTLAVIFGLPLGTFIAGAWGWHAPLFGAALLAGFAALTIKLFLPGGIVVPPVPLRAWSALLRDPKTYPLLSVSLIFVAATFTLYAYIAPFLHDMLGIGAAGLSWLLFWYGIASFGANMVLGRATDLVGASRLLALSMAGLLVSLASARLTDLGTWWVLWMFATWAISSSFLGTLQQARVVEAAPQSASALLALNTSAIFAGQAAGATLGGWVSATSGVRALPWAAVSVAAIGIAIFLFSQRNGAR